MTPKGRGAARTPRRALVTRLGRIRGMANDLGRELARPVAAHGVGPWASTLAKAIEDELTRLIRTVSR